MINTQQIKEWAFHQHDIECNQKYNKTLPYSFHLELVAAQVNKFHYLIPGSFQIQFTPTSRSSISIYELSLCLAGAYCHDLIEDARITYNDIKERYGVELADIVYACTELRGKNRSERHGQEYYNTLKENRLAIFVKLCDIIANVLFGLATNSSMFNKYKQEYTHVKEELYREEFNEMFVFLENLFHL